MFTWWGSTQEKSQTSAISATTRVHLLVGYKAIWRHTLGKSLSIVTYAAKLTVIKATSQTILRFTLPRSDSWSNFSRQKITKIPIDRSSLLNPLQTQLRKVASYIYVVLDKLDPEQLGPTVWGQFAKNHSAYRMTMENETSYRNMLVDWTIACMKKWIKVFFKHCQRHNGSRHCFYNLNYLSSYKAGKFSSN